MESSIHRSSSYRHENLEELKFETKIDCKAGNGPLKPILCVPKITSLPSTIDLKAYAQNKERSSLIIYRGLCVEISEEEAKSELFKSKTAILKTDLMNLISQAKKTNEEIKKLKEDNSKCIESISNSIMGFQDQWFKMIDETVRYSKPSYNNLHIYRYDNFKLAASKVGQNKNINKGEQLDNQKVVIRKKEKRSRHFSCLMINSSSIKLELIMQGRVQPIKIEQNNYNPFSIKETIAVVDNSQNNPFKITSMEIEDSKIHHNHNHNLINQANIEANKPSNPFQAILQQPRETTPQFQSGILNPFSTSVINNPQPHEFNQYNSTMFAPVTQQLPHSQPMSQPLSQPQFNSIINMQPQNNINNNPFTINSNTQPLGSIGTPQIQQNYSGNYITNQLIPKPQQNSVNMQSSNSQQVNQASNPFFTAPNKRR